MVNFDAFAERNKWRIFIILLLSAALVALTFLIQATGFGRIYTHLFYLPIVISCIWWQRKGIALALVFGVFLLLIHMLLRPDIPIVNDALRSVVFIIIAVLISEVSKSENEYKKSLEKTTQRLNESNEYLHKLIECANGPIMVWNNKKKITIFNKAFVSMTGYEKSFILGKDISILFAPKDRKRNMEIINMATKGDKWEDVEIAIQCKNKNKKVILWNSVNIRDYYGDKALSWDSTNIIDKDGNILATIAQGSDITEMRIQEYDLKKKIKLGTNELSEANKELRTRIAELEKFHNLTVGRELKMIQMKKEIKKLRASSHKKK